jgi:hypothetical protein
MKAIILIAAAFSVSLPVSAVTVLVDFGSVAGRHSFGSADSNGNYWDYITGNADNNTGLIDVDGNASSINLTVTSGFTGTGTYNSGLIPVSSLGPGGDGSFAFAAVTDDALFVNNDGSTGVLTLSGLNDSLTYNLSFYGSRVTASDRFSTYSVGASSVELQTSGTAIASNGTDNWNDDTVVSLTGLSPTLGQLVINLTATSATGGGGSDTFGYINAMSISAVPEPSNSLIVGICIFSLLFRRRS